MSLSSPAEVMVRLEAIELDLANRQNVLESAARQWFVAKRDREHKRAVEFLRADGSVAERNAIADRSTAREGVQQEAEYEALRAVVRTLEARASIGQSLLRAQGRAA